MDLLASPFSRPASPTVPGLVSTLAQVFGGPKTFQDGIVGAPKLGVTALLAAVADYSTLLSIRTGIGATETELAKFTKPGAFGAVLVLDQRSTAHVGALGIVNSGVGDTGIFWEGGHSSGGNSMGLGSQLSRGLLTSSTNRSQSWYVNSGAYSTSQRSVYDWDAAEDLTQRTLPFARFASDAGHTADLLRVYKGASQAFAIDNNGSLKFGTAAGLAKLIGASAGNVYVQIDDINGVNGYNNGHQFSLTGAGFGNNTSMYCGTTFQLGTQGGARPAADVNSRGKLWYSRSAGGAADTLEVCLKSAADTYSWKTISTG